MFSIFDIICLAVFAIFIFLGYKRGLITEAVKLVGAALGLYFAVIYYESVNNLFGDLFESLPGIKVVISFLLIFLLVYFLVQFIGHLIERSLFKLDLAWVDKGLGGFFGFIKSLVVMLAVVWFLSIFQGLELDHKLQSSSVSYMFLHDVQEYISQKINIEKELEKMTKSIREMFMLKEYDKENAI